MDGFDFTNLNGAGPLPGLGLQFVMEALATVFLGSLRVGAFFIASPFFGGRSVPLQARVIMAVLLGISGVSNITVPSWQSFDALTGFQVILTELAIGIGSGLILTIWFSAALLAGEKIAGSSGLSFATTIDPNSGGGSPVVSQILSLFLTVLFLSWNGHLVVLRGMLDSYQYIPVGSVPNMEALIQGGISAMGSMFFSAAIIMLPICGFLVAINLAIGVISRSSPQMNLFAVGFPITMIVIFILLYMFVDVLGHSLTALSQKAVEHLETVLGAMANG